MAWLKNLLHNIVQVFIGLFALIAQGNKNAEQNKQPVVNESEAQVMAYTTKIIDNAKVHLFDTQGLNKCKVVLSSSSTLAPLSSLKYDADKTKYKEVARVNASLFDYNTKRALGWEVSDVFNTQCTVDARADVIMFDDDSFIFDDCSSYNLEPDTIAWAYSGSHIIIQDGESVLICPHWREQYPKGSYCWSWFATRPDGTYVIGAVEGSNTITTDALRTMLLEMGCDNAMVNDGGGSAELIVDGKVVNRTTERSIANGLFIYEEIDANDEENKSEIGSNNKDDNSSNDVVSNNDIVINTGFTDLDIAEYFMNTLAISGSEEYASHKGTLALDHAGANTGQSKLYAPFDMVIVAKNDSANTVFATSVNKVVTPRYYDYISCTFGHADYYMDNIKVGNIIKKGEAFYTEGTKANNKLGAVANHCHVRFGRGKFNKGLWKGLANGNYDIDCTGGHIHQWDAFYVPTNTQIKLLDNPADNYPWVRLPEAHKVAVYYKTNLYIKFDAEMNVRVLPSLSAPIYTDYAFDSSKEYRLLEETIYKLDDYTWARILLPNGASGWVALLEDKYSYVQNSESGNTSNDSEAKETIADLESKLCAKVKECEEWEKRYNELKESHDELQATVDGFQNKISELEQAITVLENTVTTLRTALDEKTKELDAANAIIKAIRNLVG